ncbi:LysR family transcriptional regulator [Brevibacterium sediminis]|uniref:LysR family transcriptional regulator n=1 Tax=Brevibacterium sediminis TaxID=1857024 RepID=UPI00217515B9|nr:LysR family transcriptional regulator [Brevibacterium sediminis]MCS4593358.1 LysR family transcriptional regulator [Brevibacterium sediminis]
MKISWDALRLFLAVARARSISAAADELGVAQSSVSEQIARLERSLGYRLLERSSTGVRPTQRGEALVARISRPVDGLAAAVDHPEEAGERTVFLGGPAEFLSAVILPNLTHRLPGGVKISTRFGHADDLVDDLRNGTIDVLVNSLPVRGSDLSSQPIYDEEFFLVAHPDWSEKAEGDLESIPLLSYGPELPIIRRYWRTVFGHRPSAETPLVTAPDLRTLLGLARAGAGITVLPDYLVRTPLDRGELIILRSPEVAPLNTLFVATRLTRRAPDAVIEKVREAIVASVPSDIR